MPPSSLDKYENIKFDDFNVWGKAFIGRNIWDKLINGNFNDDSSNREWIKQWVTGYGLSDMNSPAKQDMRNIFFQSMADELTGKNPPPVNKSLEMIMDRLLEVYPIDDYFGSDEEDEDYFYGSDEDETQTPSPLKQTSMTPKKQKTPSPPKKKTPSPPKKVVVEDDYFTNSEDDEEDTPPKKQEESDDDFTNSDDDDEELTGGSNTPSPQKVKTPSPQKVKTPPKKISAIKQRALLKIQNYLASDIPTRSVTFAEEKEEEKKRREERQSRPKKPKKMPKGTPRPPKKLIEKVTIL
tara:strand:+ start:581 stop:1465 length:885 start_codon:yes stop_codon:yes gene_type:complete